MNLSLHSLLFPVCTPKVPHWRGTYNKGVVQLHFKNSRISFLCRWHPCCTSTLNFCSFSWSWSLLFGLYLSFTDQINCIQISNPVIFISKQSCNESTFSWVRVLHESSLSLNGQDSSPSPAGFEFRYLWLEFETKSQEQNEGAEISQF